MTPSDSRPSGIESHPRLAVVAETRLIPNFFLLLQQGVTVRAHVGCSVAAFLREEIGARAETIERIQSVILDGRPVDDLESASIKDGSVLALSAAMPGLVGATLRRGGAYSSFRTTITHHETGQQCLPGEGFVGIKIFNLLMAEMGAELLRRGVIVRAAETVAFFRSQSADFWQGCRKITLDGKPLELRNFQDASWLCGKDAAALSVTPG